MKATKRVQTVKGDYTIHPLVAEFSSDRTLNVLKTFGYEAPDILNDYSCELEDVVLAQNKTITKLRDEIRELKCRLDIL